MVYGFKKSKIDGTEDVFEVRNPLGLPNALSYVKHLPEVMNQGQNPTCVPCSLTSFINFKMNLKTGLNKTDNGIDYKSIYESRTNESDDGMTFKDAFHFLRHSGVSTNEGNIKIGRYAKIGSELQLKQAILINGPCFGALPVYNSARIDFWKKILGDEYEGGHAIAIVGYNDEGFIIRNSWGKSYGNDGYSVLSYDDFGKFLELWTVYE